MQHISKSNEADNTAVNEGIWYARHDVWYVKNDNIQWVWVKTAAVVT